MALLPPTKSSLLLPNPADGIGLLENELELAEVVGIFGVKGELRVHLHNRESEWLSRWRDLVLVAPDARRYAVKARARGGSSDRVICTIEGVDDRDLAGTLKGCRLVVDRARLPKPAEGEVYVWQMVGLPVLTPDGVVRGKIAEVHTNCPTPVLEVLVIGARDPSFIALIPGEVTVDLVGGRVLIPADALDDLPDPLVGGAESGEEE